MNTILLNAEDIKIGFRCLAELLLDGMKELDENLWFELGVNYGDEIGTKTLLSSNEKEDLIRLVLTDQCSQEEILKVGFDHVFLELWGENSKGNPEPIYSSQPNAFTLFGKLCEAIPEGHYISEGSLKQEKGNYIIEKEYQGEGFHFKNEIGYVFFTDFPAYAGEYAEPDEYETRKDFERRENLPSLGDDTAIRIFQEVEWTCSDTLYNELQYSE